MTPNSKRNVALVYARKSVVKTKRDEVSPQRQIELCSEAARSHGWTIEVYQDAEGHRSGGSEKHRPEWRRLKLQLSRPDVAAVIVSDVTRASRAPRDFYNFLDECHKRGVQFISLRDHIDTTTANGRVMLGILLALAAWEREIASERTTVAIHFKRTQGKHVGLAPFGTKRNEDGLLVENEDWPTCQTLLELYASRNYSYDSLAAQLNARGLRFRNRERQLAPFTSDAVRSVVNNVMVYAGYVLHHKGRLVDIGAQLDDDNNLLEALAQQTNAVKGQHAPLVSKELAEKLIRARRAVSRPRRQDQKHCYLLSALLYCAHCGAPMRGNIIRGKHRYHHRSVTCISQLRRVNADELEQKVLDSLKAIKLTEDKRADLRRRVEERLRTVADYAELMDTLHELERKRERLKFLFVEGDIDEQQYTQQRRIVNVSIEDVRAKVGTHTGSLDAVFQQLDNLTDILAQGTREQQRRALMDIYARIEVDSEGNITKIVPQTWASLLSLCETLPDAQISAVNQSM